MRIRLSSVDVSMWFLSAVFTRFIVENERSHLTVLTGMRAAMEASLVVHVTKRSVSTEQFGHLSEVQV